VDDDERDLIRSSARHLVRTTSGTEFVDALLDLGWVDLLGVDTEAAVVTLAEVQGAERAVTRGIDLAMQHGLGLDPTARRTVALPPFGHAKTSGRWIGGSLILDGLVVAPREHIEEVVVLTDEGVAHVPAEMCAQARLGPLDGEAGFTAVAATVDTGTYERTVGPEQVAAAIDLGRRWVASELVGLTSRMLDDTVEYVCVRTQYGRPIGTFQAVKHRLADVHVALTAARAGITSAWSDGTAISAASAKCLATHAHRAAETHCHQVHGGIAFTTEHGFHQWIERGRFLDGLLGNLRQLTSEIGREIAASGRLPRTPVL
jgi:alkylation response protein AidB-like acyl-CoA dehydrogenase